MYLVFVRMWDGDGGGSPRITDIMEIYQTKEESVKKAKQAFKDLSEDWEETADVAITTQTMEIVKEGIFYKDGGRYRYKWD